MGVVAAWADPRAVEVGSRLRPKPPPQQAPIRFQSAGGVTGSAAIKETVRLVNVSGGGGTAAPQASGQGGAGIPFGIAAASPFLALFGKMIKDKSEDR